MKNISAINLDSYLYLGYFLDYSKNDYINPKKIDSNTKKLVKDFLEKMTNEDKYIETDTGITYKNYKSIIPKILIRNFFKAVGKLYPYIYIILIIIGIIIENFR